MENIDTTLFCVPPLNSISELYSGGLIRRIIRYFDYEIRFIDDIAHYIPYTFTWGRGIINIGELSKELKRMVLEQGKE